MRKKPSIRIKNNKNSLEIIKTMYDDFGKVVNKHIQTIMK